MTQQNMEGNTEDKLDPQAPGRTEMQPPIHTHPPGVMDAAAAEKVAGTGQPEGDPNAPRHVSTAVGSGPVMDQVGGAGLGMPPADANEEAPANTRNRDIRAVDQQQLNTVGADTSAADRPGETPGESPVPRKEGEETRDVLADEVNQDQAPTQQQRQQQQQQKQQQQQQNTGGSSAPAGERSESLLPKMAADEPPGVAGKVSLDQ